MPLMTDPSVIYGLQLQNKWQGTIYRSDLTHDTPYNTYLHGGLPPGPIANPGLPALKAAMQPAQTQPRPWRSWRRNYVRFRPVFGARPVLFFRSSRRWLFWAAALSDQRFWPHYPPP